MRRAVDTALQLGFEDSCLPETGELLRVLAGGLGNGIIGETGTGCGVGLAWLASGALPGTRLVSVEINSVLASAAQTVFVDCPEVAVHHAAADELPALGPFDLLVLDGGPGTGKRGEGPVDPQQVLTTKGTLLIDDFAPMTSWPPTLPTGEPDVVRLHWLEHPMLFTTELTVRQRIPPCSILVARRRPPL